MPRLRNRMMHRTCAAVVLLLPFLLSACAPSESAEEAAVPAEATVVAEAVVDGGAVYRTRCISCHGANGEGIPGEYPPLQANSDIAGDTGRMIRVLLHGLQGELTVNEATYNSVMPPWGAYLDDDQVAAVLTFLRSHFGNEATPVTAAEVARVRAQTIDRQTPWTIAELDSAGRATD